MFYSDVSSTISSNHSEISDHIVCFVKSMYTEQYNRRAKLGALHLILLMRMGTMGAQAPIVFPLTFLQTCWWVIKEVLWRCFFISMLKASFS